MTDTEKAPERTFVDLVLFPDYKGPRVDTAKTAPNLTLRISVPAPALTVDEAGSKVLAELYNTDVNAIAKFGYKGFWYGETGWTALLKGNDDSPTDASKIANLEIKLGSIQGENFADNATDFFEKLAFRTVKAKGEGAVKAKEATRKAGVLDSMMITLGIDPTAPDAEQQLNTAIAKAAKKK